MKRILVIFSHPALQSSRANKQLLQALDGLEGITLHDLYHQYPDMFIDVKREQALLAAHDIIVFQHPFYWYSCPAIMKEWMDLVLEYGYAYGPEAHSLKGKQWLSAITTGGAPESYCSAGYNQRPLLDFLLPFQQTAQLCGPVVVVDPDVPVLLQGMGMFGGHGRENSRLCDGIAGRHGGLFIGMGTGRRSQTSQQQQPSGKDEHVASFAR